MEKIEHSLDITIDFVVIGEYPAEGLDTAIDEILNFIEHRLNSISNVCRTEAMTGIIYEGDEIE